MFDGYKTSMLSVLVGARSVGVLGHLRDDQPGSVVLTP
jgi:hypothetical protein